MERFDPAQAIDRHAAAILRVLVARWPRRLDQIDIETWTEEIPEPATREKFPVSRRTIGRRLRLLAAAELADRGQGGWTVTPRGREILALFDAA